MAILKTTDIHKTFRHGFWGRQTPVLRGVSLTLEPGEVYGFLGHNGAGKSTTMKIILGLLRPDRGHIEILGARGVSKSVRRRIGYLSEEIGLYPHLNGVEMLRLTGELFGLRGKALSARVDELLDRVGLGGKREMGIKHYSKGMRQRLGIATALMNDPELLILDEPYSGLDPVGRKEFRELLVSLKGQGKTIMMSSHIVPDVEAVCDRVGILSGGIITKQLDLHAVYADHSNDVEVIISGLAEGRINARDYGGEQLIIDRQVTIVRASGDRRLRSLVNDVYDAGGTVVGVRQVRLNLEEIYVNEVNATAAASAQMDGRASSPPGTLIHSE